ncbi:putative hemolysin [Williamsia deligens]|nr:putative hemolysin [Williamsia deligens]
MATTLLDGTHPTTPTRRSRVLLRGPRYSLHLTTRPEDVEAAQRLRHTVFSREPGFGTAMVGTVDGRDADRFDDHCDHLLVRDDHADGAVVGCARVLTPDAAIAAGGLYGAGEFDLLELAPIAAETVEMGRACVLEGHRSGSVMALMWSGTLRYLDETGHRYVVGCTSVPVDPVDGTAPGAVIRGTRDLVRDRHRAAWQVFPHRPVVIEGRRLDEIDPPPRLTLTPLMSGYLRIGARVCGEPAHDPDFGVGDFLTVLDKETADRRYLERLRGLADRCEVAEVAR